jgi:16S rRNA (adenine(1408)-N(1))-methyltransferase
LPLPTYRRFDNLPDILSYTADKIYINLPWGSLRDGIIKGEKCFLDNIKKISKANASLDIYITYSDLYEKKEIESRKLPELSEYYFNNELRYIYKSQGINLIEASVLDNEGLKKLDTKWAKKLAFGKTRSVFYFKCNMPEFV